MTHSFSLSKSLLIFVAFFSFANVTFGQAARMNNEFILQLKKGYTPEDAEQELVNHFWKLKVALLPAQEDYIASIQGTKAGVIIGDRALQQLPNFPYVYDLASAWKAWTGLPFVFAAWVSNKALPADFIAAFDAANAMGLQHLEAIVAAHPFPEYDLLHYYQKNIHYELDENKRKGLDLFLKMISANHG